MVATASRKTFWAGWVLSGIAVLFILMDASMKVVALPASVQATIELGYPATSIVGIGILELICLAVYLVPRTSPIGAVSWTGYLGGAVASNVWLGNPLFSHTLFPVYIAVLIWAGLWLRDRRVGALLAPA